MARPLNPSPHPSFPPPRHHSCLLHRHSCPFSRHSCEGRNPEGRKGGASPPRTTVAFPFPLRLHTGGGRYPGAGRGAPSPNSPHLPPAPTAVVPAKAGTPTYPSHHAAHQSRLHTGGGRYPGAGRGAHSPDSPHLPQHPRRRSCEGRNLDVPIPSRRPPIPPPYRRRPVSKGDARRPFPQPPPPPPRMARRHLRAILSWLCQA